MKIFTGIKRDLPLWDRSGAGKRVVPLVILLDKGQPFCAQETENPLCTSYNCCMNYTTSKSIMQPKNSDWLKKFVKKQTTYFGYYKPSCRGKVNGFLRKNSQHICQICINLPAAVFLTDFFWDAQKMRLRVRSRRGGDFGAAAISSRGKCGESRRKRQIRFEKKVSLWYNKL